MKSAHTGFRPDAGIAHRHRRYRGNGDSRGGRKLAELRKQRSDKLTVTIVRRELRKWLRASDEGKAVETAVGKLLAGA